MTKRSALDRFALVGPWIVVVGTMADLWMILVDSDEYPILWSDYGWPFRSEENYWIALWLSFCLGVVGLFPLIFSPGSIGWLAGRLASYSTTGYMVVNLFWWTLIFCQLVPSYPDPGSIAVKLWWYVGEIVDWLRAL